MPLPQRRVERPNLHVKAGALALLAVLTVTITWLYIASERNFHWWIDWYAPAVHVADTFRESPQRALQLVEQSLDRERNRLYTLPLVPLILVFGDSRFVYEIGLALVYLLPFALVMGAIATCLIPVHPQAIFSQRHC